MFVKDFMTRDLVCVGIDIKAGSALQMLREQGLRRVPVIDGAGQVVGLVSDRRLLEALAVPVRRGRRQDLAAPSLIVRDIMTSNVITVPPDMPMEEAGILMASRRVGSLVVVEDGHAVGIITETDMARVSLLLMMGKEHGMRVTMRAPAFPGILADVTSALAHAGGNIVSLGSMSLAEGVLITLKVADLNRGDIEAIVAELPVDEVHILAM
ncbi:MAG: CBS domain-containing protein [Anaerolineae bacterium]